MSSVSCLWISYTTVFSILLMCMALMDYKWMGQAETSSVYPTGFMNEVAAIWDSSTLTAVAVFSDLNYQQCPSAYPVPVLSRHWYGTNIGCDCVGIYSQWITDENTFVLGAQCTYNQTKYGCSQATPYSPIRQSIINNTLICG